MSSYVVRGLALLTLVIGFEAVAPLDAQAGPIHKHIEQKLLAKPAKDISLHQIVHAMEGPTTLADCVNTQGLCEQVDTCRLHRVFHSVTDEIDALMARVSLQDIINNSGLVPDDGGTA